MPYKDPEKKRVWYQANRERMLELITIRNWRGRGLLHDDCDNLYNQYLQQSNCNSCKCEFKDSLDRCLDHDHETGLFRQVICRYCNTQDNWKKFIDTPEDGFYLNIKKLL